MGNVLDVDHPDYWEWKMATQSRKAAGDPTWKERHAKGVPVKMTLQEFNECAYTGFVYPIVRDFNEGNPIARVEREGRDENVATFCNFRYKPEWLEKHKKQTI